MAYYIKVTQAVADSLGLTAVRNKTADGCVILWQSDLNKYKGITIFERAKVLGGIALTALDAKMEIDGTDNPVVPVTPVDFGGTGMPEDDTEETAETGSATQQTDESVIQESNREDEV